MMMLCRVVRGLIGFLILMQLFGLLINLLWLLPQPGPAPEYGIGSLLYRLALLLLSGGWFFGLRRIINRLHFKKHGVPHPALADQPWAL